MKKISLKLLPLSMLFLANCIIVPVDPNISAIPSTAATLTVSPFPVNTVNPTPLTSVSPGLINPTPTPKITLTPSPSPTATPVVKTGGYIKLVSTIVDWGDLNDQEKSHFKVQDFANRHLVYWENPSDETVGAYDFKWDAPPETMTADQTIILNLTTKNLVVPENKNLGSSITSSYIGAQFFEMSPSERVSQGAGWQGGTSLAEGTTQAKYKPVGINSSFWDEKSNIAINVWLYYGPSITYHYQIVRN